MASQKYRDSSRYVRVDCMVDEESMKKINVGEMKGGLEVERIVDSYNNELHSTYSAPLNIDGHLKFKCSNGRKKPVICSSPLVLWIFSQNPYEDPSFWVVKQHQNDAILEVHHV